jgi:hypothetical protein
MSSGGYTVQLGVLKTYAERVADAVRNYESIVGQLHAGDVAGTGAMRELVCDPEPEHGGAPEAFAAACRSTITNYSTLYTKLLRTHEVITARLKHMHTALVENHTLYSNLESGNALRFDQIFDGEAGRGAS